MSIPSDTWTSAPLMAMASSTSSKKSSSSSSSDLETSLLQLVNHHNVSSASLRHQTEKAKKEAIRTAVRVSELVVETVNGGVQDCFVNQKRIELEIRSLSASISRFHKQTQQWLSASRSLNTALKEIGDFENWIKVMDFDSKTIAAAIHNIHHQP